MPSSLKPDAKREREQQKFIKKCFGEAKHMQIKLYAMRQLFQKPILRYRIPKISSQIYGFNPQPQQDLLSRLPVEINHEIWSHLDNPADRVMLALTCKWHAATFEELKLVGAQSISKVKSKGQPKTAVKKGTGSVKYGKAEALSTLRRLQPWMPTIYKLCYLCHRFKPKDMRIEVECLDDKEKSTVVKTLEIQGNRCPVCAARVSLECQRDTKSYKDTKKRIEAMIKGCSQ